MTQQQLTEIRDRIASGQQVKGWAWAPYDDIEALRCLEPDQLWACKKGGNWVELP